MPDKLYIDNYTQYLIFVSNNLECLTKTGSRYTSFINITIKIIAILTKYKYLIFLVTILIFTCQVPVSGVIVWEDDFTTDSSDWHFHSYSYEGSDYSPIDAGMVIADGMLTAPDSDEWNPSLASFQAHFADHLSAEAYGN